MRRTPALLLAALAAALSLPAAAAETQTPLPAYTIANSAVLTLTSDARESYRVYVAWPEGEPPATGWPVLYLLDGDDLFAPAVVTARRLARFGDRSGIEPGVIVAIEAGVPARRTRDYTPDAGPDAIPAGAPAHGTPTGGADDFLRFVAIHIKPAIAARWRIDAARETLGGHSFGGLTALHDLYRFRHFDAYAAISPSLWFGGGKPFAAAPARQAEGVTTRLLIEKGSEEGAPPAAAAGPDPAAMARALEGAGVEARYRLMPGLTHGATMIAALPDIVGLAFGRKEKR